MVAIGALSGNLAAMLAALLAPRNLATAVAASSSGSPVPPAPGGTGGQGVPSPNALNPGSSGPSLSASPWQSLINGLKGLLGQGSQPLYELPWGSIPQPMGPIESPAVPTPIPLGPGVVG